MFYQRYFVFEDEHFGTHDFFLIHPYPVHTHTQSLSPSDAIVSDEVLQVLLLFIQHTAGSPTKISKEQLVKLLAPFLNRSTASDA